jgi:hypothetical protein
MWLAKEAMDLKKLKTTALDSRITDDGEVVSLTRRPPFTPQEGPSYSFLLRG